MTVATTSQSVALCNGPSTGKMASKKQQSESLNCASIHARFTGTMENESSTTAGRAYGRAYTYPSVNVAVERDYFNMPLSCAKMKDLDVVHFVTTEEKVELGTDMVQLVLWKRMAMTNDRTNLYNTAKGHIYERIYKECIKLSLTVPDKSGQLVQINEPKLLQRWVTGNENHELTFAVLYKPFEDAADSNTKRWSIEAETMRRCGFRYTLHDDKRKASPNGLQDLTGGGAAFLITRALSDIRKHANYHRKKSGLAIISVLVKSHNKDERVKSTKRRKFGEWSHALVVDTEGDASTSLMSAIVNAKDIGNPVSPN